MDEVVNNEMANEPAPVIEKVSLDDIKEAQEEQELLEVHNVVKDFLSLTPEEKEAVKQELFKW